MFLTDCDFFQQHIKQHCAALNPSVFWSGCLWASRSVPALLWGVAYRGKVNCYTNTLKDKTLTEPSDSWWQLQQLQGRAAWRTPAAFDVVAWQVDGHLICGLCAVSTDVSPGNHNLHMWERPHQHFTQHTGRTRHPARTGHLTAHSQAVFPQTVGSGWAEHVPLNFSKRAQHLCDLLTRSQPAAKTGLAVLLRPRAPLS